MILITKSILGLKDPVTLDNKKYLSSLRSSSKLIGSVIVENELSIANHLLSIIEERRDREKIQVDANSAKIKVIDEDLKAPSHRLILHTKNTGSWLNIQVTTVTGTVLASTESFCFFVDVMMLPHPNL